MQFSDFYFVKAFKIWHGKSKMEERKRLFIENKRFNKNDVGSMSNENWIKSHILIRTIVNWFYLWIVPFYKYFTVWKWKTPCNIIQFNNTKFHLFVHSQWNFQFQDIKKCVMYALQTAYIDSITKRIKKPFRFALLRFFCCYSRTLRWEFYSVTVQNSLW